MLQTSPKSIEHIHHAGGFVLLQQKPLLKLVSNTRQVQKETLPWVQDLLEPLLQGPPKPLTGEQLCVNPGGVTTIFFPKSD